MTIFESPSTMRRESSYSLVACKPLSSPHISTALLVLCPRFTSSDVEDLSFSFVNGCSISYRSRIPLGGSIKIYFVEAFLRSLPVGGDGFMIETCRGACEKGREIELP
jgi:hypothetical protein